MGHILASLRLLGLCAALPYGLAAPLHCGMQVMEALCCPWLIADSMPFSKACVEVSMLLTCSGVHGNRKLIQQCMAGYPWQ